MALYQEAASIVENAESRNGSLKSVIYSNKASYRSNATVLFALISEVSKWDVVLKEVIDNTGLLSQEPKVNFLSVAKLFPYVLTNTESNE